MNWQPFDVGLIQTKLSELAGPTAPIKHLGTMAEYSKITDLLNTPTPAAYALLSHERTTDATTIRHAMVSTFGVVMIIRDVSSQQTDINSVKKVLEPLIGEVRGKLIGWTPSRSAKPIELVGGQVVDFVNGVLVWMDSYQVFHVIGQPKR